MNTLTNSIEAPVLFSVQRVGNDNNIIKILDQQGRCLLHTDVEGALTLLHEIENPPVIKMVKTLEEGPSPEGVRRYQKRETLVIDPDLDWDSKTGEIFDVLTLQLRDEYCVNASVALHGTPGRNEFTVAIRMALPNGTRTPIRASVSTIRSVHRSESVTKPFKNEGPLPFTVSEEAGLIVIRDHQLRTLIKTTPAGAMALVQIAERKNRIKGTYRLWDRPMEQTAGIQKTEHLTIEAVRKTADKVDNLSLQREASQTFTMVEDFVHNPNGRLNDRNAQATVLLIGKAHQVAFIKALKAFIPASVQPHARPEAQLCHVESAIPRQRNAKRTGGQFHQAIGAS